MCLSLRFKTPLLRGEPNTQLDQFKKIEALISSDLDHWLCNLYFQVCICVCIRNIHMHASSEKQQDSYLFVMLSP